MTERINKQGKESACSREGKSRQGDGTKEGGACVGVWVGGGNASRVGQGREGGREGGLMSTTTREQFLH